MSLVERFGGASPTLRWFVGGGDGVDGFFEAVILAGGIGLGGGGVAEEVAEVDEVLVSGGFFGEGGALPFGDELLGGHGAVLPSGRVREKARAGVLRMDAALAGFFADPTLLCWAG